ncbi:hypothetical protein KFE25_013882 [Diacronema lutheri]|uniref:Phospholipid scramblase n=1 Tax=Diacronema lutheri TaxID=2081491 RepID=A0A8J5XDM4_DIALT|nr:hypothetical protein KFE25_013882 [Diacronema lutheri]
MPRWGRKKAEEVLVADVQSDAAAWADPPTAPPLEMLRDYAIGRSWLKQKPKGVLLEACCCQQENEFGEMVAHDATTGEALGSVRENFFCCVVSYTIRDATGTPVYDVHPPTCLSGICVNCCDADSAGCMCFRAPFYIYPADGGEETRVGKLTKVWTGITKECCTLANTFEVDMPTGADGARASLVLGAGLLIDHNFFEGRGGAGANA